MITQQTSRTIVEVHRIGVAWFSTITIAFQVFFALWIFPRLGLSSLYSVATLAAATALFTLLKRRDVQWRLVAVLLFLVSLACWMLADRYGEFAQWVTLRAQLAESPPRELLWLSPAIVFGFALCPYLDRTFHIARSQLLTRDSRLAFGFGFGVFFAAMIVFTLHYALPVMANLRHPDDEYLRSLRIVGIHWMFQLAFTIAAHLAALRFDSNSRAPSVAIIGLLVGVVAWLALPGPERGLDEIVYRMFMGFYGLIFPAYVWLCLIPGHGRVKPSRRQLIVFTGAVLIALPMFWMGFIQRQMIWLSPGLAIVMLARLLIPKRAYVLDAVL